MLILGREYQVVPRILILHFSDPYDDAYKTTYGYLLLEFTMSLFIGSLAFTDPEYQTSVRLGVLIASLFAGVLGYLTLRLTTKPPSQ